MSELLPPVLRLAPAGAERAPPAGAAGRALGAWYSVYGEPPIGEPAGAVLGRPAEAGEGARAAAVGRAALA